MPLLTQLPLILGNCSLHCPTSGIHAVVTFSPWERRDVYFMRMGNLCRYLPGGRRGSTDNSVHYFLFSSVPFRSRPRNRWAKSFC